LIELKQALATESASPHLSPEDCALLAAAVRVPPLRTSTLARSKDVENRVARYLWGESALRTWEAREDIRNDELRLVGEVKSYQLATVTNSGGVYAVLYSALLQVTTAINDDPGLSGYAPFSVLVVPRQKLERALVMFPVRVSGGTIMPLLFSLEWFAAFSCRKTARADASQYTR
jgi:hypothetical protein